MEGKLFVFITMCLFVNDAVSFDGYKARLLFDKDLVNLQMFKNKTSGLKCGHNLCEHDPTYPKKRIHHLLDQIKNSPVRFGTVFDSSPRNDISNKFGGTEDGRYYSTKALCCPSRSLIMEPQSYQGPNNNKIYIVNHSTYKQRLIYKICTQTEPRAQCKSINKNYKCEQRNTIIKLLKYEDGDAKLNYGEIPIPSACVLTYQG